ANKQDLFIATTNGTPHSYPLTIALPPTATPSLIDRVQDVPDIENGLRRLKEQRLESWGNPIYIPPQAKASLQAPNDAVFPLMENVKEFLSSDRQVILVLGDSGAGKS